MRNKINYMFIIAGLLVFGFCTPIMAETAVDTVEEVIEDAENLEDQNMENASAEAVSDYQIEGSLFQQITDLEQEKVLLQLEKERAQLDLELDKLAAEKIKLQVEIDNLSGKAEQQAQEIEAARAQLEAETARLEQEKKALENGTKATKKGDSLKESGKNEPRGNFEKNYELINVIGTGSQLYATILDLTTGQSKKLSVGKNLGDYTVKSISLDDGVVLKNADGDVQVLGVNNSK